MKLYVTESNDKIPQLDEFDIVPEMEECDEVLILPGGLGAFYDMFRAIKMEKEVIVYNRDLYFTSVIKNMYQAYEAGYIEGAPSLYVDIESEIDEIIRKLEEKKNG